MIGAEKRVWQSRMRALIWNQTGRQGSNDWRQIIRTRCVKLGRVPDQRRRGNRSLCYELAKDGSASTSSANLKAGAGYTRAELHLVKSGWNPTVRTQRHNYRHGLMERSIGSIGGLKARLSNRQQVWACSAYYCLARA
jgi:hypothetical protein